LAGEDFLGGKMKHAILNVLIMLIFVLIILMMQFSFLRKYNALGSTIKVYMTNTAKEVSQLERDVRLLKTDMYVLQNGYEESYE
jgi:hypothetical protein